MERQIIISVPLVFKVPLLVTQGSTISDLNFNNDSSSASTLEDCTIGSHHNAEK